MISSYHNLIASLFFSLSLSLAIYLTHTLSLFHYLSLYLSLSVSLSLLPISVILSHLKFLSSFLFSSLLFSSLLFPPLSFIVSFFCVFTKRSSTSLYYCLTFSLSSFLSLCRVLALLHCIPFPSLLFLKLYLTCW